MKVDLERIRLESAALMGRRGFVHGAGLLALAAFPLAALTAPKNGVDTGGQIPG